MDVPVGKPRILCFGFGMFGCFCQDFVWISVGLWCFYVAVPAGRRHQGVFMLNDHRMGFDALVGMFGSPQKSLVCK